jgi:CRISPR-associated endonuclease Csn1
MLNIDGDVVMHILGLDIGIASVGFALVELDETSQGNGRIVRTGVRLFDAAEEPKTGASLAYPRRMARASRRVIRRRAGRMAAVRALFEEYGLDYFPTVLDNSTKAAMSSQSADTNPWQLRAEGLERSLSKREFARALYHIAKHRGFFSTKKGEGVDKDGKEDESGKLLKAAKAVKTNFEASGCRTAGEYFYKYKLSQNQKVRNGNGTYDNSILRLLNREEVHQLFAAQRALGVSWADEILEARFVELFFKQAPLKSVAGMVGFCELEPTQRRAPKYSRSAELFILWQKINHLRIKPKFGQEFALSDEQRQVAFKLAHTHKDVTFKQLRKALSLDDDDVFKGLTYSWPRKEWAKLSEEDRKNKKKLMDAVEKARFVKLDGYHALHPILGEPQDNPTDAQWDEIAQILSFEQSTEAIQVALFRLEYLTDAQRQQLATIQSFKGTVGHSVVAIEKMLAFLVNQGMTYDKAKLAAGYELKVVQVKQTKLPKFEKTNNPVVDRALAQTRKVINALIREHDLPDRIHVEMGRDTAKTFEDRMKIQRQQKENETENQQADKAIAEELGQKISRLKYRLWQQQNRTCLYSGLPISPDDLLDDLKTQIDHALPYSRSFDNSFNNKVLVFTEENQQKKNRTIWEYFKAEKPPEAWDALQALINHFPRPKQEKILMQNFDEEVAQNFKERNLNDTRWAARTLKNHIEQYLDVKKVMTVNGQLTAFLRNEWGLESFKKDAKGNRVDNARHHAVDAVAIACATQSMVQKVASHNRYRGRIHQRQTGDKSLLFAEKPWPHFRHEIERLIVNNPEFFVSRMPKRKMTGEIASPNPKRLTIHPETGKTVVVDRVCLADLNDKKLERLIDKDTHNSSLYKALATQLALHGNDGKKAFKEGFFRYNDNKGHDKLLYKVSLLGSPESGQVVRGGLVSNGDQIRVDVFKQDNKYYLCVVYASDVKAGKLPQEICGREEPKLRINDDYDFLFSLYPNDYVEIWDGKTEKPIEGYYVSTSIAWAQIILRSHDGAGLYPKKEKGKDTLVSERNFGVMTLKSFKKYQVDVLGNKSLVREEKRLGLAIHTDAATRQAEPAAQPAGVPE